MSGLLVGITFVVTILMCNAEIRSGQINMDDVDGFGFIGKFCFTNHDNWDVPAGIINLDLILSVPVHINKIVNNYRFILYSDEATSWKLMYDNSDESCDRRTRLPTVECNDCYPRARQHVIFKDKETVNISEFEVIHQFKWKTQVPIYQVSRPRFWWLYMVNCQRLDNNFDEHFGFLEYTVEFTQNNFNDWNKEIGMNEYSLNTVYIIFWLIFSLLFIIELIYFVKIKKQSHIVNKQNLSEIVNVVLWSLFCKICSLGFMSVNFINLSLKGKNIVWIQILSNIFDNMSYSIFLLLLMLLSQGWMIMNNEINNKCLIYAFVVFVFLFETFFYIWRIIFWYQYETTLYFYDSLPQWLLGTLMFIVCLIFVVNCVITLKHIDNNNIYLKRFFRFLILYCWYFLWYFIRIPIAKFIQPWKRDYISIIVTLIWQLFAFGFIVLFLFYYMTFTSKMTIADNEDELNDDDNDDENNEDNNDNDNDLENDVIGSSTQALTQNNKTSNGEMIEMN